MSRHRGCPTWRKVVAGSYESHDGQHRVVRSEGWEGPLGGTLRLWDHLVPDAHGWHVTDSYPSLRAAKVEIERKAAACH